MNGAALRIRQREEDIKNMTKVSGAFALQFTVVDRSAAKLEFHTPPKVMNPNPVPGGE